VQVLGQICRLWRWEQCLSLPGMSWQKYIIFTERTFLMNAHVFAIVVFTEGRSKEQVQEAFEATTPSCKQEKPDENQFVDY